MSRLHAAGREAQAYDISEERTRVARSKGQDRAGTTNLAPRRPNQDRMNGNPSSILEELGDEGGGTAMSNSKAGLPPMGWAPLCVALTCALFVPAPAAADDEYRGKVINVIVGGDPGGYDTYARLLARHLPDHVSGKPEIVIRNMPGAGGLRAANYVYEVAPKDGSVIGAGYGGVATADLFKIPGVRFDPRRFQWLGSMSSDVGLTLAWHTARVKTIQEAMTHELVIGGSGQTSANVVFPTVMNKVLGTKFKVITGYKGGSAIALAMERGEIEGVGSVYYSSLVTRNPDWLSKRLVNVLVQLSLKPHERFAGIPVVTDLARSPEDRALLELVFAPQEMSRPFMLPPGTSTTAVDILRAAFDKSLRDPGLLGEAAKQHIEIGNPMSGGEVRALIDKLYAASPAVIARGAAASNGKLD